MGRGRGAPAAGRRNDAGAVAGGVRHAVMVWRLESPRRRRPPRPSCGGIADVDVPRRARQRHGPRPVAEPITRQLGERPASELADRLEASATAGSTCSEPPRWSRSARSSSTEPTCPTARRRLGRRPRARRSRRADLPLVAPRRFPRQAARPGAASATDITWTAGDGHKFTVARSTCCSSSPTAPPCSPSCPVPVSTNGLSAPPGTRFRWEAADGGRAGGACGRCSTRRAA